MAQEYNQRPSALVGLSDDPYAAYCLDEAVYIWATHVERELDMSSKGAKNDKVALQKRQRKLTMLMIDDKGGETQASTPMFRDPAARFKS